MKTWLNGNLFDSDHAHIDIQDRGFLLGDGVFETMSALDARIVDGRQHFTRLRQGADFLGIPISYSDQVLGGACSQVLQSNGLTEARASVRLTVTRGPGSRGLLPPETPTPTILVTAAPASDPPKTMSVIVAGPRRNELSPLSRYKTLNYLDNVVARREAASMGADEALMLNTQGHVACASAANIWLVEGDRLVTPRVSDGALPGIARQRIIALAGEADLDATEDSIDPARLSTADQLFLSNSLIGICPISSINGQKKDGDRLGPTLTNLYWTSISKPLP